MTKIRPMVVCPVCQEYWVSTEPPACVDPSHHHLEFEFHVHRSAVVLADRTKVTAVSFDAGDPYAREDVPDFGLYLDERWQPPWPHEYLDWPDFGVPADCKAASAALRRLLERARAGERVELGCLGGHGRTGTALACLAVLAGYPSGDAIAWVRANYCDQAVESEEQSAFVTTFALNTRRRKHECSALVDRSRSGSG